jgi:predicted nuclease of predicted toxin-antitoxin system
VGIALYMDHNVPRAITLELRRRGVNLLTAFEDGAAELEDPDLLDRATSLGRALFTRDDDLLKEATRRQQLGIAFAGVIYAHQLRVTIGTCIRDLEILAKAGEPEDLAGRVEFLPL